MQDKSSQYKTLNKMESVKNKLSNLVIWLYVTHLSI